MGILNLKGLATSPSFLLLRGSHAGEGERGVGKGGDTAHRWDDKCSNNWRQSGCVFNCPLQRFNFQDESVMLRACTHLQKTQDTQ